MKEKMLETSIELFGRKGFREASIRDIVEANGMTKGTFYYYFRNKEDVLVQIHEGFINDLLKRQKQIFNDESKSCKEQLYAIVEMLISSIRTKADHAMVFFREMRHLSEEKTKAILPKRDLFQRNLAQLIKKGSESGEFRKDLRTDMMALAVLGVANWSYFWYEPDGEVKEKELTDLYMKVIFEGIEEG